MSGIVAMVWGENSQPELATLEKMTAHLAYRGPDAHQSWSDTRAGLGHALLNVDILANPENQPLSPDGRVWITADARIDDRDALVSKLEQHESPTALNTSDAVLVAEAYRAFGTDCPQHLVGDFAFAIWDQPAQRLLAAVDRFAIRPLYYAWAGKTFIVSNCLATFGFTLPCARISMKRLWATSFYSATTAKRQRRYSLASADCRPPIC